MDQEMKYVYTVYKCRSFSEAARKLYITQPALSLAVRRAEEALGEQIFDRSARTLTLTEAGELYIRKYYEIRDLENELHQQVSDLSTLLSGTVHIGGTNYFNSYILPPVITAFHTAYPGIRIELTEAGSYELPGLLKENRIDLTFLSGLSAKDPYIRIPCFTDTVLLCVPKAFPLSEQLEKAALTNLDVLAGRHLREDTDALPVSLFKEYPLILLSKGNNLYERCMKMFAAEEMKPQVVMTISQLATAWHLACEGLAATFISDHLVMPGSDSVLFFKINSEHAERKFDLIMSERRYISHAMKAFADTFTDYYREER
jgi:DNA-binding transcriptional LysR family regulator